MKQKPLPLVIHVTSTLQNKTHLQKFFLGAWLYGIEMGIGCLVAERLLDKYKVRELEVRN